MSDTTPEKHVFQAEIQQLLDLVVHSLYTDKEIFLRELISNASDAMEKLRHIEATEKNVHQPTLPLEIHITTDEEARTLTIADYGIGMSHDDYAMVTSDAGAFDQAYAFTGNPFSMASGRIAHALGLHGPALTDLPERARRIGCRVASQPGIGPHRQRDTRAPHNARECSGSEPVRSAPDAATEKRVSWRYVGGVGLARCRTGARRCRSAHR